jgi:hypothetical protein
MQPMEAPEPCKDRDMLRARMRADLLVYRDCVSGLNLSVGKDFEQAHQRAESARLAFEAARKLFNEHLASHRCG